jgi:hypothetical protein
MVHPPAQDARQHAALVGALLIGAQLLLGYWFYSYLTWRYPLLIIAIIQARLDHEAGRPSSDEPNPYGSRHRLRRSRRAAA